MTSSVLRIGLLTCEAVVSIILASETTLGQQKATPNFPIRNQPLPTIDKKKVLLDFNKSRFEGLDPVVGNKISKETRGSIAEIFDIFGKGLQSSLKLDEAQVTELNTVLKKRAQKKEALIKPLFRKLADTTGEIPEPVIQLAVKKFLEKDLENELVLTQELVEILDPIQIDKVCKVAMGKLRPDFARVPLVAKILKLTADQQAKYEACRLANEEFSAKLGTLRTLSGKSYNQVNKDKGDPDKEEMDALYVQCSKKFVDLMTEADNSLNAEQFLFVARSVGFVKDDETLNQYFERQSKQEQARLAITLGVFRALKKD